MDALPLHLKRLYNVRVNLKISAFVCVYTSGELPFAIVGF